MIDLETKKIRISEDTLLYLQKAIVNLDMSKFEMTISNNDKEAFSIFYQHSLDGINYSDSIAIDVIIDFEDIVPVYICFKFVKNTPKDLTIPNSIYNNVNVDSTVQYIILESIQYDNEIVDLTSELEAKFQTIYQLVNEFPRWNLYDNQSITVSRWLQQCNAIAEMYGHTCIYFKTRPVEDEAVHTFRNYTFRNVVDIKKLHVLAPGNELPQNRVIYTEWDMPLSDDFILHVVKQKFEQAFGEGSIPEEKDYIYLPIINKLFRVSTMQPKSGLMGKIAWWEVFLAKFEDDECVSFDEGLKEAMSGFDEILAGVESIEDTLDDEKSQVLKELNTIKVADVISAKKIDLASIEEKKLPTENFTNKLKDSSAYISVKETENLREFYNNRLQIISVNSDTESFPITMYNNTKVGKRVVALSYNLKNYTTKNNFSLEINAGFKLSFNYVLTQKFTGEIFEILSESLLSHFTVQLNRDKIEVLNSRNQKTNLIDFQLLTSELYNIEIIYTQSINQIAVKVYMLENTKKTLKYQNIYNIPTEELNINKFDISNIYLYGGMFYSGNIELNINNKNILTDYVNPILGMMTE